MASPLMQQKNRKTHERQVSFHKGCRGCHALAMAVELVPEKFAVSRILEFRQPQT